jgi:murein L,D-transpeptidase YcbB/YkuD
LDGAGPARGFLLAGLLFLALGTCGAPFPRSLVTPLSASAQTEEPTCGNVSDFYNAHPGRRIWVEKGKLTQRGRSLVQLLSQARADGLDPNDYLDGPANEKRLSSALVRYVHDLGTPPAAEPIYYIDASLRPPMPCPARMLDEVARADDLAQYLGKFEEPNSLAAALRAKLSSSKATDSSAISRDLALARSIGHPRRFVLVDTSSQRLWMFDEAGPAGTMKVVVGKSGMETPPMAGLIRFAVVNPYWDIPPDIVRNEVAPRVEAAGADYLATRDYEAVTSYDSSSMPLEASAIDWAAVRKGTQKVGVRQLPGPGNMMGRVMFMFPNRFGIYLHDTPGQWIFSRNDRRLSHGCVRLEHADLLYRWLFRRPLASEATLEPQTHEDLGRPVPVYILHFSSGTADGGSPLAALPQSTS